MPKDSAVESIKTKFVASGGPAMKNVRKMLLQKFPDESLTSQAMRYLSRVTLHTAQPVFPALLSMGYEAVGGTDEKAVPFGEGILLVSFAADLHDDVIDQSTAKGKKQTILGKFGTATTILAGDMLLSMGMERFTEAARDLPKPKFELMIKWVSEAVLEICRAEALQLQLKNNAKVAPSQYLEVIKLKSVVPELCIKLGAFLGTDLLEEVERIGRFGRLYGINSVIVEEFADLLNIQEFVNRAKNECLPLPMIYASQNQDLFGEFQTLLASDITRKIHGKIVNLVLESEEVNELQKLLTKNALDGQNVIPENIKGKIRAELENLLLVPLKFFES